MKRPTAPMLHMHVALPVSVMNKLDEVTEKVGAASRTETIRRAIVLLYNQEVENQAGA